ncbi:MAG: flagellar biosynthetic protein FliR [Lachnospiraceae bacterium]|nr:flagellar biosynthetic protein FliR [Lachnospiraceae bacterium]
MLTFLLIVIRITTFIYSAPFFNMGNTPARVKIGLGIFVSYLIYQVLLPVEPLQYDNILGYSVLVLKEAMVGLIIGFGANICMSVVNFTGNIIDMETGMAMATLFDPQTNQETSISGVLYQYAMSLMLIVSGMYQYLLKAIVETYTLIPINGAVFDREHLLNSVTRFMGNYLTIGFRICLPVFCAMILLNAILGIMAKVSPQMNMFAVGMQLKVLVGLGILFLAVSMLPNAADFIFTQMKVIVVDFVEGMT